jgi:hypothetical protein
VRILSLRNIALESIVGLLRSISGQSAESNGTWTAASCGVGSRRMLIAISPATTKVFAAFCHVG